MDKPQKRIAIFSVVILILLFIGATYIGQTYEMYLIHLFQAPTIIAHKLAYIALLILATVFAPLATLPLMPIATAIWGPFITALLNIVGWFFGAIIAFYISRRYGLPIAQKFITQNTYTKIDSYLGEKRNLFFSVVILRMIVPVDILSYVLGLIPKITWSIYIRGTLIGIIPFSFVFAYLGALSVTSQIVIALILIPIFIFVWTQKNLSLFFNTPYL